MHILSESSSASSRCYELIIIERPSLMILMRAHTCLLDSTSSPEVGSSRIISFEPPTKAIASESFLFMPPDRFLDILSLCSFSITISRMRSISASFYSAGISLSSQTKFRCSWQVSSSKSTSNCWQRPMLYLTPSISVSRSCPYILAEPLVGWSMPVMS